MKIVLPANSPLIGINLDPSFTDLRTIPGRRSFADLLNAQLNFNLEPAVEATTPDGDSYYWKLNNKPGWFIEFNKTNLHEFQLGDKFFRLEELKKFGEWIAVKLNAELVTDDIDKTIENNVSANEYATLYTLFNGLLGIKNKFNALGIPKNLSVCDVNIDGAITFLYNRLSVLDPTKAEKFKPIKFQPAPSTPVVEVSVTTYDCFNSLKEKVKDFILERFDVLVNDEFKKAQEQLTDSDGD